MFGSISSFLSLLVIPWHMTIFAVTMHCTVPTFKDCVVTVTYASPLPTIQTNFLSWYNKKATSSHAKPPIVKISDS
jgi:hypothetical protein